MSGGKCVPWHKTSPFLPVISMWTCSTNSTHAFHRSSGPTQVNRGQLRSNEVNDLCLAPSAAKLSAITGFRHFSALDLTSEITGWPRTLSLYTNRFVSQRATRSFFREALAQSGAKRQGAVVPPPPPVPWRDAKWPVPARVKLLSNSLSGTYLTSPFSDKDN